MPTQQRVKISIRARRWQHQRRRQAFFSADVWINGVARLTLPEQPEVRKNQYIDQAINFSIHYCQLPERSDGESVQNWIERHHILLKHHCSECARAQLAKTLSVRDNKGNFIQYVSQHKDRRIFKSSHSFPISLALQQAETLFRLAIRHRQLWTTQQQALWDSCHSITISQYDGYQLIATLHGDTGELEVVISDGTKQKLRPGTVLKSVT